jgi:YD repeat-containing protein
VGLFSSSSPTDSAHFIYPEMDEDRILKGCPVRIATPRAILSLRIFPQCRNLPAIMLKRFLCPVFLLLCSSAWASLAPEAYDRAGQLTSIQDSGKGEWNYRYDPVGRLTESLSPLGREKFAFDPASNLLDTRCDEIAREEKSGLALETEKPTTSKLLDNLLKDYAGTYYRYDERGNLVEKIRNEERTRYQWNASNQLVKVETSETITQFAYGPLGRRIIKHSTPVVPLFTCWAWEASGERWKHKGRQRNTPSAQPSTAGTAIPSPGRRRTRTTSTNPTSFILLAQEVQNYAIQLHKTPDWTDRDYSLKDDPLWTQVFMLRIL